jgi:hypothetical protein
MPEICKLCRPHREFPNLTSKRMHVLRKHKGMGSGHGDMAKGGLKANTRAGKIQSPSVNIGQIMDNTPDPTTLNKKNRVYSVPDEVRQRMSAAQKLRYQQEREAGIPRYIKNRVNGDGYVPTPRYTANGKKLGRPPKDRLPQRQSLGTSLEDAIRTLEAKVDIMKSMISDLRELV